MIMRTDDRRNKGLPGGTKSYPQTFQGAISYLLRSEGDENSHYATSDIAKITEVHPETMTVDLESWQGPVYLNIPVIADTGLITNEDDEREVYGEFNMPRVDEYVVVMFLSNEEGKPFVWGKITPYAMEEWKEDMQKAVKSEDKQFTTKLYEADLEEGVFRRIFQSGTTIEVDDKGTTTLETPSGTYFQVSEEDEDNPGSVKLVTRESGDDQVVVHIDKTASGNTSITLPSGAQIFFDEENDKVLVRDSRGHKIEFDSSQTVVEAFGNMIQLVMGMISMNNGNLEVLQ